MQGAGGARTLQRLASVPAARQAMLSQPVHTMALHAFPCPSVASLSTGSFRSMLMHTCTVAKERRFGNGFTSHRSATMRILSRGYFVQPALKQEAEMDVEGEELDPAALQRLEEYKALLHGLTSGSVTPRRSAVQRFIATCETKQDVSKAVVLVDKYKTLQFSFNKETGSLLLTACTRAEHFDAAIAVLQNARRLRLQFSGASGQRLLATLATAGQLDTMLSAHSLLLKASVGYDNQKTQIVVMRGLVKGSERRLGDALKELENSRLRGVKGHKASYKLLLQAINDEMQAGGDGGLGEEQTLLGLRTKIKGMLTEDGLGSPPEDAIVQLLLFQPTAVEEQAPGQGDDAEPKGEEGEKKE